MSKKSNTSINLETCELIYDPERGKNLGSGPRRYPRGTTETDTPSGVGIVPLAGTWILPGRNQIPAEELEFLKTVPEFSRFLKKGIYQIITPVQNPTGTLADYSVEDAKDLIANTYDTEALELEIYQEKRPEVLKAIREQIKFNQEQINSSNVSLASRS